MPDTQLPDLVPHADWIKGTSKLFASRSPQLKAVDAALLAYERSRSTLRFGEVGDAFDTWKQSKGPGDAWKQTGRDGSKLVTLLDQQLRGLGDTDTAMGVPSFMEPALVNARLGVLYLFANMKCEDSIFKVVLNGAMDLTTSSLDFVGGDSFEKASTVIGKSQDAVGKAADLVERKIRERGTTPKTVTAQQLTSNVNMPLSGKLRELWDKIKATLYKFATQVWAAIRQQLAAAKEKIAGIIEDPAGAAEDMLPTAIRKLCDLLAGKFLANAAPFIGAGLDLAKGVANTVDAGFTKFKEWLNGRNVVLLAGHQATIVEAIRRAMWFSVGEGLYDTLKGGLKLGLEFASSGASAIGSLIVSIVEALVKTIWKVVEISRMNKFFAQARVYWDSRREPSALHERPIAFNYWFKRYAIAMPALSVLALNSGICGDKMHFLKMYKSDDTVVSQATFDAGVRYVDSLKIWGSKYLDDCGYGFGSDDGVVKGLLTLAQSHRPAELSKGRRAANFFLKFLNA